MSRLVLYLCLGLGWPLSQAIFPIPSDTYTTPGDLSIASLIYLHDRLSFTQCNDKVSNVYGVQMHMAEVFAIEKINSNSSLLGKVKLGYKAKEECFIGFMSVGQTLEYLGVDRFTNSLPSNNGTGGGPVVGITGPLGTTSSMALAGVLSLYQTPQISQTATNDILSDKGIYPYFYRTVPPDSFQTRVMMDTLQSLNWTYISVVHEDDTFGYNAIKYIRRLARDKEMCIADSYPVDDGADERYFDGLATSILKEARYGSHGVILFLAPGRSKMMLEATARKYDGSTKLYYFLSADSSWISTFQTTYPASVGSLTISWSQQQITELDEYLRGVRPSDYPENIFLRQTWDDLAGCDLARGEVEKEECYSKPMGELDYYFPVGDAVQSVLGIYAYGHAIDDLIRAECPAALEDPELVTSCVQGEKVSEYLKTVQIPLGGSGESLSFNENGEIIGDYKVKQLQYGPGGDYGLYEVGIWPQNLQDISLYSDDLRWTVEDVGGAALPSSLCAKPCGPGEAYIQGELSCCWECRRCRNNEYVTNNATSCDVCPYLTWPDQETFTTCERIPASFLNWRDVYGISLLAMAGCSLVAAIIVLVKVIQNRGRRVIKGAVIDMLFIILSGIFLAFASVPLYILPANDIICIVARVTFSIAVTLIFGPVFVKTQLVYHVFAATEKFKRSTKMASTYVKVTLTLTTFLIQVVLISVSLVVWPVSAIYKMPVLTERYVELQCEQELEGLLLPLSYNIFLLSLCSIFGFLTRKLPDNFNESWYIFISVSTTLFVWIAFLPTYFSAFYAYHKAALLALALLLNGTVVIFCLFAPKMYALYYVAERDIKVSDFSSRTFSKDSTMNKTDVSVIS